jgi:hypothetical protein
MAAGGWVGVAVVLLQNLVDLALEVPGVCIALVMTLGSLWGDGRRRGARRPARPSAELSLDRAALATIAFVLLGLGLIALADRHRGQRRELRSQHAFKRRYEALGSSIAPEARALRASCGRRCGGTPPSLISR